MANREQLTQLAELVHLVRPAWDTRAVAVALQPVEHRNLADLAAAAIRCALNPQIRKPTVIAMEGEHWSPSATSTEGRVALHAHEWCRIPGHSGMAGHCQNCRADQLAVPPDPFDVEVAEGLTARQVFLAERERHRQPERTNR